VVFYWCTTLVIFVSTYFVWCVPILCACIVATLNHWKACSNIQIVDISRESMAFRLAAVSKDHKSNKHIGQVSAQHELYIYTTSLRCLSFRSLPQVSVRYAWNISSRALRRALVQAQPTYFLFLPDIWSNPVTEPLCGSFTLLFIYKSLIIDKSQPVGRSLR